MEFFMYPVLYMRITQGYNMGSHLGYDAVDDGCSDSLKDYMVAPYSGTVKQIYPQYENQVFFESDEPVLFEDGTIDYAVTMFGHQDSPMAYGMCIGKHYNQGEKIYIEGGRYAGKNGRLGTHVHLEFAKGKFTGTGWYRNKYGYYCLNNHVKPEFSCFIDNNYHILYNYGYNFVKVNDWFGTQNYKALYNMNVRTGAGTNFPIKKVKDLSEDGKKNATSTNMEDNAVYKAGTIFTAKEIIRNEDGSIWAKSPSGYICLKQVINNQNVAYVNKA